MQMPSRVMIVFGTRPEAIKMAPICLLLKKNKNFDPIICTTSQHVSMLNQVLDIFSIKPNINLKIMKKNQDLFDININVLNEMKKCLLKVSPEMVLVHGDTTTAYATSIACFYLNIPVSHIEAGLRTNNIKMPFPEEFNRQIISKVSSLHFAPTQISKKNLLKEKINEKKIIVTGNTVIDSLHIILNRIKKEKIYRNKVISYLKKELNFNFSTKKFVLITGHRRENFGDGLLAICNAIKYLAKKYNDIHFIYPVHLNPNVIRPVNSLLKNLSNVHLINPLPYDSFSYLLSKCFIVLTDSGGIQEEAPSLGKPVIVMREVTERPEAVKAGTVKLSGANQKKIISLVQELIVNKNIYRKMSIAHNPYGDGKSAKRILKTLIDYFK